MKYADSNKAYVPAETGQIVSVGPEDAELLRLLFGDHAVDVADLLRRDRPAKQYVQVTPPHEDSPPVDR